MKEDSAQFPDISVIIPAFNEERFIAQCLTSLYEQDYPSERMQVIVVDGNSTDETAQIVRKQFPQVTLLENPDRIVPISMNMGIRIATGEYIVRLDAHALYPTNYISTLITKAKELNADNIGACWLTEPGNTSSKARAIAIATSTKFGMGNADYRLGTDKIKRVDTVPFGCYHRTVFDKIGLYDEELVRNQDDELNARLIKSGGKIYLLPNLEIKYFARENIKKVARMFYQYGLFKPLGNKKVGAITTFRQLVPFAFVSYIALAIVFTLLWPQLTFYILAPLFLYLIIDIFYSLAVSSSVATYLWLLVIYPVVHFSYGVGYWHGIIKILFCTPFTAKSSR